MLIKVNDDGCPFPPSKHVGWFHKAWDDYHTNPTDDAADELWDIYNMQCDKITEEYREQVEADCEDVWAMPQERMLNELGELADLVQATMQKMYMLSYAANVPVSQIMASTTLKCLARDNDFYTID